MKPKWKIKRSTANNLIYYLCEIDKEGYMLDLVRFTLQEIQDYLEEYFPGDVVEWDIK